MDSSTEVTTPTRRRWLIATLRSVAEAADDVQLLPWSRGPGRAQRKASARARALAE